MNKSVIRYFALSLLIATSCLCYSYFIEINRMNKTSDIRITDYSKGYSNGYKQAIRRFEHGGDLETLYLIDSMNSCNHFKNSLNDL